jgi:pimeloyl-ACP methyl ester carboxylesterase
MKLFSIVFLFVALALFVTSRILAHSIESRFPPIGEFRMVGGVKMHFTDHQPVTKTDHLPVVFIHGASGNLRDLQSPLLASLEGKARLVFVDRPGQGYSERGSDDDMRLPWGQARIISLLLKDLGFEKAIIVGHSLGGSTAAAFAVNHPDQTGGLVFLAPATHPWPGAGTAWYYTIANLPVVGWLFTELVAVPAGILKYSGSVESVFTPNPAPENYEERSGTKLVLRPDVFRYNAQDVKSLFDAVSEISPRYGEISVPTSIITGDRDDVVLANIHSVGLARDIKGSKLIWIEAEGHMPAWTHPELVAEEIDRVNSEAKAR